MPIIILLAVFFISVFSAFLAENKNPTSVSRYTILSASIFFFGYSIVAWVFGSSFTVLGDVQVILGAPIPLALLLVSLFWLLIYAALMISSSKRR